MYTLLFLFPDDNFRNSSIEILLLLTVAFILGYLLRLFISRRKYEDGTYDNTELQAQFDDLQAQYDKIKVKYTRSTRI